MPCLLVIVMLGLPRLILLGTWLFTNYVQTAFENRIWPILGFCFMPITTIAYMWASNETNRQINGIWILVVVVGAMLDLGILGSSKRRKRRKK